MSPYVIDAFEFCRLKERREGEILVADLPRLADESVGRAGALRWVLTGGKDGQGREQLALSVSGAINLPCQRCLAPFVFDIASDSVLVLAPDEPSADELDAQLADEPVEVVVGSRHFDIKQLIEDEALLAIPLSPRHEACGGQPLGEVDQEKKKESPFAVLKNLKR